MKRKIDDSEKKTKDLEHQVQSNRREKELMMATYCRLIKENERLHSKFLEQKDAQTVTGRADDKFIRMLEMKLLVCCDELKFLKKTIPVYESRLMEAERRRAQYEARIKELEVHHRSLTLC